MSIFGSQGGMKALEADILPPEDRPRGRRSHHGRGEVIDVQFVTVRDAGSDRRSKARSHNDNHRSAREKVRHGGSLECLVGAVERSLTGLSADLFSAVVAVVFVCVFSLMGGFSFLFSGGSTGGDAPALDISHITLTPQDANGMRVLLVNGIVENRSGTNRVLPSIRAELISDGTVLTSTLISPPAHALAAGHSRGFSARIPHPGGKLPDLRLSLADKDA